MKIRNRLSYYLLLLAFPLFFILHGINENFGLISAGTAGRLFLYYFTVSAGLAFLSECIIKNHRRAFIASFILLLFFFFFGAVKDFAKNHTWLHSVTSYKIILPALLFLSLFALVFLKKTSRSFRLISSYLSLLIVVVLSVEVVLFVAGLVTDKEKKLDFGDADNEIARSVTTINPVKKPIVFWMVFDEYSGQTALKERWNYDNPVDSLLRSRGFFVADSATSNYNYTHYSLTSTLDMTYLKEFEDHAVIGYRDALRGHYSLKKNNAVELFRKYGYQIENYTLYDLEGYPTKTQTLFGGGDFALIDNQTLPGRIQMDIGWNFRHLLSSDKKRKDSIHLAKGLKEIAVGRDQLLKDCLSAANKRKRDTLPTFFMYHFMYTHEPFLYGDNGEFSPNTGFRTAPEKYVASVKVANKAIQMLVDSIMQMYAGRELAIVIQGDHGFKFDDVGPLFQKETCSILYAVYCSDGDYSGWYNSVSSINGFRSLFNKYFGTGFAKLPDKSYFLNYR